MRRWLLMGGLIVTLTALVAIIAASYSGREGRSGESSLHNSETPSPADSLIPLPDMAGIPKQGAALLVSTPDGFCFEGNLGSDEIEGCRDTKITIKGARGIVSANARLIGDTEGRMTLYLVDDGELVDSAETITRAKPVTVSGHF